MDRLVAALVATVAVAVAAMAVLGGSPRMQVHGVESENGGGEKKPASFSLIFYNFVCLSPYHTSFLFIFY